MTIDGVPQPNFLQLRVDMFRNDMFQAADEWDAAVKDNAEVQAEKKNLLIIHPPGTTIGGVRFGLAKQPGQ